MKAPFKVIEMHDMSAYGRSSLTATFQALSVLNCQVCPVPTAYLSHHFGFKNLPSVHNMSDQMRIVLEYWKDSGFSFDGFHSGYLADPLQADIAINYIDTFNIKHVYVDPVLGDAGKLYHGFNPAQIESIKKLLSRANAISPNLTEALFLLNQTQVESIDLDTAKKMLIELSEYGPEYVCITGVPCEKDNNIIYIYAYDKTVKEFYQLSTHKFDAVLHGTGDSFASVIVGLLFNEGLSYKESLIYAMSYLYRAVEIAVKLNIELCLEGALDVLIQRKKIATLKNI